MAVNYIAPSIIEPIPYVHYIIESVHDSINCIANWFYPTTPPAPAPSASHTGPLITSPLTNSSGYSPGYSYSFKAPPSSPPLPYGGDGASFLPKG